MSNAAYVTMLVLASMLCRALITRDPVQSLLVPAMTIFHEAYDMSGGKLGPTNTFHLMVWAFVPWAYGLWLFAWEIGSLERKVSTTIISKDKTSKQVIEHSVPLLGMTLSGHSIWNTLAEFQLNIIGTSLEPEYIGTVGPENAILDENFVMTTMSQIESGSEEAWGVARNVMSIAVMMASGLLAGYVGLAFGSIIVVFVMTSKPRPPKERNQIDALEVSRCSKLPLSDGIYRLNLRIFDVCKHVGIGYVEEGILHTRYHVTLGNSIEIQDQLYTPSYINKSKDNVAYGGVPRICQAAIREEFVVALAGPYSNSIHCYKSKGSLDENNNMVFYGNRSMPGTSGSPIFRIVNATIRNAEGQEIIATKYALIGTIGWFYEKKISDGSGKQTDERKAIEIAPNDAQSSEYHVRYVPGNITQLFKHPGAGKTRTIAKDLIIDGINQYGKVYFSGPTRVVCEEAYNVFKDIFPSQVSLCTSSATTLERGSSQRPIMVVAHATALSMLARGSVDVMKKGLWILDEAHFNDSKTMVLKDYLRHKVTKEGSGSLVEMTATGYDIINGTHVLADGCNVGHIEEVIQPEDEMVNGIIADAKTKKVMVFVTSLNGKQQTSAQQLARRVEQSGAYYIILSRHTFSNNYKEAKARKVGVILTTDISECGANIHPDIVYDFQLTSKVVNISRMGVLERRVIDQGQRVQRRGRVGRDPTNKNPAIYVSPGHDLPLVDYHRIEHHERHAAAKALKIEIKEPTVQAPGLNDIDLTPEQIATWASSGEGGFNSLRAIHMATNQRGFALHGDELKMRIDDWAAGDDASVMVNQQSFMCGWWDQRDRIVLEQLAAKVGKINIYMHNTEKRLSMTALLQRIINKGRPPIVNHLGIIRECENTPDETQEPFPSDEREELGEDESECESDEGRME